MHILCLGLNHATAPIALRERLAFSEEQARAALARISCGQLPPPFPELLILSTCNRTELYAIAPADSFAPLEAFLSEARLVPPAEFQPLMYRFLDLHAVEHLFRVSAGLDSMVLGEPQILGQVTRALELARGQDTAGPMLNRLFQAAIHAGKRARTETAISRNSASVSSLAASAAALAVEDLEAAAVVVLGAGEMAGLTVESLRQRGVRKIQVINRTLERARQLASRWEAEPRRSSGPTTSPTARRGSKRSRHSTARHASTGAPTPTISSVGRTTTGSSRSAGTMSSMADRRPGSGRRATTTR